ncbi:hypothetical protein SAMN05216557_105141 [Sphingomonas carotinifaciens]|nr:hypothetical protein SAMN05216557_105141 [Sphingomonas carotinifaciens]
MSGEDDEESVGDEADPPITEETAFDLKVFAASDPNNLPPGEAAALREL